MVAVFQADRNESRLAQLPVQSPVHKGATVLGFGFLIWPRVGCWPSRWRLIEQFEFNNFNLYWHLFVTIKKI